MTNRGSSLALLAALAVGLHCESAAPDEQTPLQPVPIESFDTRLIGDPVPADNAPRVVLLDPGAEPRSVRQYNVQPGQPQTLEVVSKIVQQIESDGQPLYPTLVPVATLHAEVTRLPGDSPRYRVQLRGAEAKGFDIAMVNTAKEVQELVDKLGQHRFEVVIGANGLPDPKMLEDAQPDLGPTLMQVWQELKGSLSLPFPDEPIGIGARWKLASPLESMGLLIAQSYELTKIEGEVLYIEEHQDMRVSPGAMGAQMTVREMNSSGKGLHTIRLNAIAPQTTQSESTLFMRMEIFGRGEKQNMELSAQITRAVQTR